jgi:dihydropteroate synthase
VVGPVIRIEDAGLGADAPVRLVVSGVSDLARLRAAWAPSGAVIEPLGERLRAVSTVEALVRAAGRTLDPAEAEAVERAVRDGVRAWLDPVRTLPGVGADARGRCLVMGVVNVTPDSFSDGGALYPDVHPDRAVAHGRALLAEGADLLDVGGESTRPGARAVAVEEELRRVVPVVEALAGGALVSVDTVKPQVARAALRAGARMVNDVSGAADRGLLEAAAEHGALYVLMHTRGTPDRMQSLADYGDVVAEVYEFLAEGVRRCAEAGLPEECVLVDPGIGFAKTAEHNLALLRALRQFTGLGRPVLLGASRKSFLGALLDGAPPEDRLEGSLACAALAANAGAAAVRVHDVRPTVRVVRTVAAVQRGSA